METLIPSDHTQALLETLEDNFFQAAARESVSLIGEPAAHYEGEAENSNNRLVLEQLAIEMEGKRIREAANVRTALFAGNLTKTERRILAHDAARKSVQQPWVDLGHYQHIKAVVKANRSGSKQCACGTKISANKPKCATCATDL